MKPYGAVQRGMLRNEKLLTPEDMPEWLRLSPLTVMDYLRKAQLKGVKVAKHWQVCETDLQTFIAAPLQKGARTTRHDQYWL
jgi:hypothetical protein